MGFLCNPNVLNSEHFLLEEQHLSPTTIKENIIKISKTIGREKMLESLIWKHASSLIMKSQNRLNLKRLFRSLCPAINPTLSSPPSTVYTCLKIPPGVMTQPLPGQKGIIGSPHQLLVQTFSAEAESSALGMASCYKTQWHT